MGKFTRMIAHPLWALKRTYEKYYIFPCYQKKHRQTHAEFLATLEPEHSDFFSIVEELINDDHFNGIANRPLLECGLRKMFPVDPLGWPAMLFFIIRETKPETVVETGVWYGYSTSVILNALHQNQFGRLISIDLPALFETGGYRDENPYLSEEKRTVSLPPGKQPGFIIPDYLKDRWEFIPGDSKTELPKLFKRVSGIDIFLHDSLHSYENMIFEYSIALKNLKPSGLILSDNIDWNGAFDDFSKKHNLLNASYLAYYESKKLRHNFGMIMKREKKQ